MKISTSRKCPPHRGQQPRAGINTKIGNSIMKTKTLTTVQEKPEAEHADKPAQADKLAAENSSGASAPPAEVTAPKSKRKKAAAMVMREAGLEAGREFNPTEATKQAVQETALSLGLSVLTPIARIIGDLDGPRFDRDGKLTGQARAALLFLAVDAYQFSIHLAFAADWFDYEVINQTRKEIGLEPIS
jgi:hypothetical protein